MTLCRVLHPALPSGLPPRPRGLPLLAIRRSGGPSRGLPLVRIAPWAQYVSPAFEQDSDDADYPDAEGWYYVFPVSSELTGIAVLGLAAGESAIASGLNHYWANPGSIHLITTLEPRPIYTARVRMAVKSSTYVEPGEVLEVEIEPGLTVVSVEINGSPYREGQGIGCFETAPPRQLRVWPDSAVNPTEEIEVIGFLKLFPVTPAARVCLFSRPQYYHCDYFEWVGRVFSEVTDPLNPVGFDLAWNTTSRTATLYIPPDLSVPRRRVTYESVTIASAQWVETISRAAASTGDWLYPLQSSRVVKDPLSVLGVASESAIKLFTSVILNSIAAAESYVRVTIGRSVSTSASSESATPSAISRAVSSLAASSSSLWTAIARTLTDLPASESGVYFPVESQRITEAIAASESLVEAIVSYGFRLLVGSESGVQISISRTTATLAASESSTLVQIPRVLGVISAAETSGLISLGRSVSTNAAAEAGILSAIARTSAALVAAESALPSTIARTILTLPSSESGVKTRPLSLPLGGDVATWLLAAVPDPIPDSFWNAVQAPNFAELSSAIAQILSTENLS